MAVVNAYPAESIDVECGHTESCLKQNYTKKIRS
jgi:hypothetical protein